MNGSLCIKTMFLLITTGLLSQCSKPRQSSPALKGTPQVKVDRGTLRVGKIHSINRKESFVLINISKPKASKDETSFYVEHQGRRATLNATGENMRNLIAADIINGSALVGDPVIIKSLTNRKSPTPALPTQDQTPPLVTKPSLVPDDPEKLTLQKNKNL